MGEGREEERVREEREKFPSASLGTRSVRLDACPFSVPVHLVSSLDQITPPFIPSARWLLAIAFLT